MYLANKNHVIFWVFALVLLWAILLNVKDTQPVAPKPQKIYHATMVYPKTSAATCHSSTVTKASAWGRTIMTETGYVPGQGNEFSYWRAGFHTQYVFCPNGSGPRLAKFTRMHACLTYLKGPRENWAFQGIKFDPWYFAANSAIDSGDRMVWTQHQDLKPGDRFCRWSVIPLEDRHWMYFKSNPRWNVIFWEKYVTGFPEQEHDSPNIELNWAKNPNV